LDGPVVVREHAFLADGTGDVRLSEHDAFEWLDTAAALERMPFAGLKVAVRRAHGR
jgi:hypothetical protein